MKQDRPIKCRFPRPWFDKLSEIAPELVEERGQRGRPGYFAKLVRLAVLEFARKRGIELE